MALSWYENKQIRKDLHPLMRVYRINEYRPSFKEFDVPAYESESFYRGGYQRKDLTEGDLKAMSDWLYTLEPKTVVNDLGLKFKYAQDAIYYKLKWCDGGNRDE